MSKPVPAFLKSANGTFTIYYNQAVHSIDKSHLNYGAIEDALKTGKYDNLSTLLSPADSVKKKLSSTPGAASVQVRDGQVFYGDEVVHNTIVDRILNFIAEGYKFEPLVKFLDNLMQNPSKAALDNLYRFLEHNKMPITEDGCFLAYKRVRDDYKDIHSGTKDNSPGQTVTMPRNKVQDDPNVTCSYGLHVAALEYPSVHFGSSGKIVVCKVNPRDVVSVPTDYNNQKMRVCEYVVLEDFKEEIKQENVVSKEVPMVDDDDYDDEDSYLDDDDFDDEDDDSDLDDDYDDEEEEDDDC
jgi:hypothetical protein